MGFQHAASGWEIDAKEFSRLVFSKLKYTPQDSMEGKLAWKEFCEYRDSWGADETTFVDYEFEDWGHLINLDYELSPLVEKTKLHFNDAYRFKGCPWLYVTRQPLCCVEYAIVVSRVDYDGKGLTGDLTDEQWLETLQFKKQLENDGFIDAGHTWFMNINCCS